MGQNSNDLLLVAPLEREGERRGEENTQDCKERRAGSEVKDTAHKRAAWSARSLQGEGAQHMYKGYRQAQAN